MQLCNEQRPDGESERKRCFFVQVPEFVPIQKVSIIYAQSEKQAVKIRVFLLFFLKALSEADRTNHAPHTAAT